MQAGTVYVLLTKTSPVAGCGHGTVNTRWVKKWMKLFTPEAPLERYYLVNAVVQEKEMCGKRYESEREAKIKVRATENSELVAPNTW